MFIATKFNGSDEFDDFEKTPRIFLPQHMLEGKMLLWWIRWYGSYLPLIIRKPLYMCLPCMGSLWSIPLWVVFSVFNGFSIGVSIGLWVLFAMAVSGLNTIIRYNFNIE